jgi:drug/metabolite transporter (DMT)-like permease
VGNNKLSNWGIFIALSIIWGSSFILMMKGLVSLSAYQVASLRIVFSGIVLLPVAIRHIGAIPKSKLLVIFLSGVQGSLLPAYLFCIAETKIDSSLAGSLNALTPVFVIIMGAFFFNSRVATNKILGICISFAGSVLLFLAQPFSSHAGSSALYTSLVVIATMLYGLNVNMVGKYLKGIPSLHIAAIALSLSAIPALIVLYFTGYFHQDIFSRPMLIATGYTFILGVLGTAFASIFFYVLMKRAGMVFASMVTYAIPAVAIMWAILDTHKDIIFAGSLPLGEIMTIIFYAWWKQFICLLIILSGVYIANRVQKDVE